jgi:heme-degrading monooxygenase HmoA
VPTIRADRNVFTVVVRLTVSPEDEPEIRALSETMVPVFARQPGFVSMALHRSHDGTELLSYLQWQSRQHHEACQASPEVAAEGREWMEFVGSGRARFEIQTFDVVATAGG